MTLKAIVIDAKDNVANLIGAGKKGQHVQCEVDGREMCTVTLLDDIPPNHKFALADIGAKSTVIKYGLSIGKASRDITCGQHVHVHNIESSRGRGDLR